MTVKETREVLQKANVYETIGFGKMIIVLWWTIVKSDKSTRFMFNLSIGMNAYSAYNDAKRF